MDDTPGQGAAEREPERGARPDPTPPQPPHSSPHSAGPVVQRSAFRNYLKLARLHQWGKGVFVLVGPVYGAVDGSAINWGAVGLAFLGFGLGSSACYVVNDIRDREADKNHPRKCRRPVASGAISVGAAWVFAALLLLGTAGAVGGLLAVAPDAAAKWTGLAILAYIANVTAYTYLFKHHIIADVVSLAIGFVLRVLGGCAAAEIEPSTWLLNCTLFVSMFLAFAKRLGERRTREGGDASQSRAVQSVYTDDLLRMAVVVTGVAALVTYAGYVQARSELYTVGFNLLWLTMLPATYGLLRCIVLVERGDYDDPTELAIGDRAFQVAGVAFVGVTIAIAFIADRPL